MCVYTYIHYKAVAQTEILMTSVKKTTLRDKTAQELKEHTYTYMHIRAHTYTKITDVMDRNPRPSISSAQSETEKDLERAAAHILTKYASYNNMYTQIQ